MVHLRFQITFGKKLHNKMTKNLHKSRSWECSSVISFVSFFGKSQGGIWNGIISEDAFGAILIDDRCSEDTDWTLGNSLLNNISEVVMLRADYCNLQVIKNVSTQPWWLGGRALV